jgi:hypothetical protein
MCYVASNLLKELEGPYVFLCFESCEEIGKSLCLSILEDLGSLFSGALSFQDQWGLAVCLIRVL